MTFEIELNGRARAVSVERVASAPHQFRLTIDGVQHLVDAARLDDGGLSLVLPAAGASTQATQPLVGTAAATSASGNATVTAGAPTAASGSQSHAAPSALPAGGGAAHHVIVSDGPAPGELTIAFPGTTAATLIATVNGRRVRRGGDSSGTAGVQRIVAPMPGRVLRVLAAPGAEVAARQPLVVVEAMKMENELSSPKAGLVKEVLVTEGQSVEAGRLLVIVE